MDDQTAISRIKQGDLDALETLVSRYQVKAVSAAYMILHNRPLAEDIVQSAFLRCTEKIHQFEDGRPFAPWFFRIVMNDAVKTAQRQSRWSSLEEEPEEGASALAGWMTDPQLRPEEQIEINEAVQFLRNALQQLSPPQRAVMIMRYYLDMSEAEMAARLDRPVSTVKWWLRMARKRLSELIKPRSEIEKPGYGG